MNHCAICNTALKGEESLCEGCSQPHPTPSEFGMLHVTIGRTPDGRPHAAPEFVPGPLNVPTLVKTVQATTRDLKRFSGLTPTGSEWTAIGWRQLGTWHGDSWTPSTTLPDSQLVRAGLGMLGIPLTLTREQALDALGDCVVASEAEQELVLALVDVLK